jgi:hypothetical protein
MRGLAFAIVFAAACGGGGAPPDEDAHPLGPLCSDQLYDLCVAEENCMTGACQNFGTFQVCSQSCGAMNPCPEDKTGAPATCDNGACKPSEPNMCHLPGQ